MNNDIEISWQTFRMLPAMRKLSLNEQQLQYHYYVQNLERTIHNSQIQTWTTVPEAGDSFDGLLQENLHFLLQENGNKIRIT
jgi:hypothetical protein